MEENSEFRFPILCKEPMNHPQVQMEGNPMLGLSQLQKESGKTLLVLPPSSFRALRGRGGDRITLGCKNTVCEISFVLYSLATVLAEDRV